MLKPEVRCATYILIRSTNKLRHAGCMTQNKIILKQQPQSKYCSETKTKDSVTTYT